MGGFVVYYKGVLRRKNEWCVNVIAILSLKESENVTSRLQAYNGTLCMCACVCSEGGEGGKRGGGVLSLCLMPYLKFWKLRETGVRRCGCTLILERRPESGGLWIEKRPRCLFLGCSLTSCSRRSDVRLMFTITSLVHV